MLHANLMDKSGFRPLLDSELKVVSGGYYNEDPLPGGQVGFQNPTTAYFTVTGIWVENQVVAQMLLTNSGGTGFGTGGNPDAVNHGCPTGQTCTPIEGFNDMYVRGEDGKIYLSPQGIDRAVNGADIDWWGVTSDLGLIISGALGTVGAGVVGIVALMLGVSSATIGELFSPDSD